MVAVGKVGSVKTAEQMKAEYREVISLLSKGYSIRDVAKVKWKGREYGTTSEAINKSAITAIIQLILRSFQRKGLCESCLKAKSITFVNNIKTEYNGRMPLRSPLNLTLFLHLKRRKV